MPSNSANLVVSLAAVATILGAGPAAAQAPEVAPGDRVRVATATGSRGAFGFTHFTIQGSLIEVNADSVVVDVPARGFTRCITVPSSSITAFERSIGTRTHIGGGILYGLLGGAVLGAVVGQASYEKPTRRTCEPGEWFCNGIDFGPEFHAAVGAAALGVVGALIGGMIGASTKTDRWEAVPLGTVKSALSRGGLIANRRQLGLSLKF